MSLRFWVEWATEFRWQLALIGGLTILSSAATLAVPWLAVQLLSGLLGDQGNGEALALSQTLIILVSALVCITALTIAASIVSQSASLHILTELRKQIYQHVQLMPLAFHDEARRGDILALTSYEVGNLGDFLADTIANAPAMLFTAIGALMILFLIDPVMALMIPILVPVFVVLVKLAGRRLRIVSGQVRVAEAALIEIAERDLEMLPAIKSYATEKQHYSNFAKAAEKSRHLAVGQLRLSAFIGPTVALCAALSAIAVLVIGSEQLETGDRSASDLFAFLLYAAILTRPIGALAKMYGSYQLASGTLARLEEIFALRPELGYSQGSPITEISGDIRIDNVNFAYPSRPPTLRDVSLEISHGEIVALTGDNGVGKSTLVRLLLRFYEPNSGRILLDQIDIADLQVQELRRQFGYVPQRALLFNGTVAQNIVFGQSDPPSLEAVEAAARIAQVDQFIAELPSGFETEIGDNGVRLSGGQRQRISLARALYRDPPIYILDEATSMYDLDSEAAFVENCINALEGKTVIIITHRQASLALADRVFKLDERGASEITKDSD